MLQFLSSVVVLALAAGALALIVWTIRDAFDSVLAALLGDTNRATAPVTLTRRTIRPARTAAHSAPRMRAAA